MTYAQIDTSSNVLPLKDGKIVYEQIVEAPGVISADLFGASKKWFADSFKNPEQVVQSVNESTGQVIGKATSLVGVFKSKSKIESYYSLKYSIQIDCKDGKARIRFYDIQAGPTYNNTTSLERYDQVQIGGKKPDVWQRLVKKTNMEFYLLASSFDRSVNKIKKDDF